MIVEQGCVADVFARPHHPYSAGLLSSVLLPNPRIKSTAAVNLKGEIPSPISLPVGCFLASRCPFADDRCETTMPSSEDLGGGHRVHCLHHRQVVRMDRTANAFQREAEPILSVKPSMENFREE
jgi:oligopeptide/dipeptide ABC transporter ATP-binding protein